MSAKKMTAKQRADALHALLDIQLMRAFEHQVRRDHYDPSCGSDERTFSTSQLRDEIFRRLSLREYSPL